METEDLRTLKALKANLVLSICNCRYSYVESEIRKKQQDCEIMTRTPTGTSLAEVPGSRKNYCSHIIPRT